MQGIQTKRHLATWLAAFFLVALGAKLWTIQLWATNMPYWDQWDEARLLFKPWLEGTLTWHDFFIPHNEHRIAFTRLLDLVEVMLNGRWDIYLQDVVNALIHLAYGCGLAAATWYFTGRRHAGLICCLLLPFFALPFAAENTISGFQSSFYLANLFSLAAILGLGFGKPGGRFWFGGWLLAGAAIFTVASGFLAAAAIVGLVGMRVLKNRSLSRGELATLLGGLIVVAAGLALKVTVARHAPLQAASVGSFFLALAKNLAWPFMEQPGMTLLMCLPLVLIAVEYFRGTLRNPRSAEFVLVLGGWALLQALALAYGRAQFAEVSRYYDTLSAVPLTSGMALFVLASEDVFSGRLKKFALPLALAWSVTLIWGQVQCSQTTAKDYLEGTRWWGLIQQETVRSVLATGDVAALKNAPREAVPYWSADWLGELLSDPRLVAILPDEVFPPADQPRSPGVLAVAARWLVDQAVTILCTGLLLCAVFAVKELKQPGMTMRNEGLAWLGILIITIGVGIGVISARGTSRLGHAAALHKRMAVLYATSGQKSEAVLHLREALRLQPNDALVRHELEVLQSAAPTNQITPP